MTWNERKKKIRSRFLDLSLELSELGDRQLAVLVVIEALDEVQRALLGVVELSTQNAHGLVETDEVTAWFLVTVHIQHANFKKITPDLRINRSVDLDFWSFDLKIGSCVTRVIGFHSANIGLPMPFRSRVRSAHNSQPERRTDRHRPSLYKCLYLYYLYKI